MRSARPSEKGRVKGPSSQAEGAHAPYPGGTFPRRGSSVITDWSLPKQCRPGLGSEFRPSEGHGCKNRKVKSETASHRPLNTAWGQRRVRTGTYQQVGSWQCLPRSSEPLKALYGVEAVAQ